MRGIAGDEMLEGPAGAMLEAPRRATMNPDRANINSQSRREAEAPVWLAK
jgi:hypothetical protein